jgi:hypothetical protein
MRRERSGLDGTGVFHPELGEELGLDGLVCATCGRGPTRRSGDDPYTPAAAAIRVSVSMS